MNKYTLEQRKMIAEYLESEVLPLSVLLNQNNRIKERWVNESDIKDKIKNLKALTFGEIKNQVGAKLKFMFTGEVVIVARDTKTSNIVYFDVKNSVVFDGSAISDKHEVEVINE